MADISTLFNLDPTQFALGRSTGRFRNVVGTTSRQSNAELGALLQGIQTVTAAKPGEFTATAPVQPVLSAAPAQPNFPAAPTAPTISPFTTAKPSVVDPKTTAVNYLSGDSGSYSSNLRGWASPTDRNAVTSKVREFISNYFSDENTPFAYGWSLKGVLSSPNSNPYGGTNTYYKAAEDMKSLIQSSYNQAKSAEQAKIDSYNSALASYNASTKSTIDAYNASLNQYKTSVQPLIDKYNTEVSAYNTDTQGKVSKYNVEAEAYNKILNEYKQKVDTYNTDVNRYQKEVEDTRNKFQKEYLSQNVNQELIPAEGEVLAASSLYSDTLHQEMLNKVAEANASEPSADRVTSLYSTGK